MKIKIFSPKNIDDFFCVLYDITEITITTFSSPNSRYSFIILWNSNFYSTWKCLRNLTPLILAWLDCETKTISCIGLNGYRTLKTDKLCCLCTRSTVCSILNTLPSGLAKFSNLFKMFGTALQFSIK